MPGYGGHIEKRANDYHFCAFRLFDGLCTVGRRESNFLVFYLITHVFKRGVAFIKSRHLFTVAFA